MENFKELGVSFEDINTHFYDPSKNTKIPIACFYVEPCLKCGIFCSTKPLIMLNTDVWKEIIHKQYKEKLLNETDKEKFIFTHMRSDIFCPECMVKILGRKLRKEDILTNTSKYSGAYFGSTYDSRTENITVDFNDIPWPCNIISIKYYNYHKDEAKEIFEDGVIEYFLNKKYCLGMKAAAKEWNKLIDEDVYRF